jgi:hypothetical protein
LQNVSEHSVEVGEVVEIVRQMPETAMIQIMKNGRIGVIPKVWLIIGVLESLQNQDY